ncbi:MAG: hypothetical protein V4473_01265 [Patescibacteria group bacterium]
MAGVARKIFREDRPVEGPRFPKGEFSSEDREWVVRERLAEHHARVKLLLEEISRLDIAICKKGGVWRDTNLHNLVGDLEEVLAVNTETSGIKVD